MTLCCKSLSDRLFVFSQFEALSGINHVLDRELDVLGAGNLRGDHARFVRAGGVSNGAVGEVTLRTTHPVLPRYLPRSDI